jgi:hypothetical protein
MYYRRKMAMFALACIGFGKDVAAAEWEVKGDLGQQLEYNDNISLNTIRKDSVAGYVLRPSLQASRKTEVLDIAFEGLGDIRRYDDSNWDCDNYNLSLNNQYKTKRSVYGLSGGYSVSCSYAQQITDTGLLVPNSQSEEYRVEPSWAWQWTERDKLSLIGSYSKTSYSNSFVGVAFNNQGSLNFSGNETYSVNLGESHEWSRRLTLTGNLFYSNIEYTGFGISAQSATTQNLFGFVLGANYEIDKNWSFSVGGGPVWVDGVGQNFGSVSQEQNSSISLGSNANIDVTYDGKLTKFSAGYSNSIDPSSLGQTLQNHNVFANYSYRFTQHLLLDLSGNFSNNQSIGGGQSTGSQFDRTYFTTAAGIAWEPTRNWQLKGSYVYSWQDYQQDQDLQNLQNLRNINVGTSHSNAVMLFLNYSWDGIQRSR